MKWEEFALSILINATSPCRAWRNKKKIPEERPVPLSRLRQCDWETAVDLGYTGNIISGEQHF